MTGAAPQDETDQPVDTPADARPERAPAQSNPSACSPSDEALQSAPQQIPLPPKPANRADRVSLLQYLRLFRRDILSAQPARLYRAWMAEFRTPFFRSFLVNQPELVERVLKREAENFPKSDRIGEGLRPLLGNSVFLTNGETWKRQRRIIDPAFEGGGCAKAMRPSMLQPKRGPRGSIWRVTKHCMKPVRRCWKSRRRPRISLPMSSFARCFRSRSNIRLQPKSLPGFAPISRRSRSSTLRLLSRCHVGCPGSIRAAPVPMRVVFVA